MAAVTVEALANCTNTIRLNILCLFLVVTPGMKRTPSVNRTPRRSTSMVSTLIRPFIERKQHERSVSPASSFSSSILARGMSEAMTPQKTVYPSRAMPVEENNNRRRAIDFSRRRTVAGPIEPMHHDKENLPVQRRQHTYRASPLVSNDSGARKYFFHSNTMKSPDDAPVNSYGFPFVQPPVQPRHSVSTVVMMSQTPSSISTRPSQKPVNRRASIQLTPSHRPTPESLDDMLCDREVESYFYPSRDLSDSSSFPQHVYINLQTPPNHYQPLPYIQGTLC